MDRIIRRAGIGALAGAFASTPLMAAMGHVVWVLSLGVVLGAAFSMLTGPTPGAYLDNMLTAGAYGVPLWAVISVIALPLASGQMPEWSAEQMRSHFPVLVGWVLFGVILGLLTQLLNNFAARAFGPETVPATDDEALDAFQLCCKIEGIIPALEPAHALAQVIKLAPKKPKDHLMVMNLCGRGDKDIFSVAEYLGGM